MAAALQRGICEVLGIDMNDIGVVLQYHPERIVFYDNTAGGAGFVLEAKDRWPEVEARALKVARDCICQDACHRCLKHFGNQSVYDDLRWRSPPSTDLARWRSCRNGRRTSRRIERMREVRRLEYQASHLAYRGPAGTSRSTPRFRARKR